ASAAKAPRTAPRQRSRGGSGSGVLWAGPAPPCPTCRLPVAGRLFPVVCSSGVLPELAFSLQRSARVRVSAASVLLADFLGRRHQRLGSSQLVRSGHCGLAGRLVLPVAASALLRGLLFLEVCHGPPPPVGLVAPGAGGVRGLT